MTPQIHSLTTTTTIAPGTNPGTTTGGRAVAG